MKHSIDSDVWTSIVQLKDASGRPVVIQLWQLFKESAATRLKTIKNAITVNNSEVVAREAHLLKSAAANLGAAKFSGLCSALEGLAKAMALLPAAQGIQTQLEDEFTKLIPELEKRISEANRSFAPLPADQPWDLEEAMAPSNLRVLVVDDDPFYRVLLTRLVAQIVSNPDISTADTAEKALSAIDSSAKGNTPFNLVVADLNLKSSATGVDIWNACNTKLPKATFMLISGMPLDEFLALVGEMSDPPPYLPKPFRLDQCRTMLQWLLQTKRSGK